MYNDMLANILPLHLPFTPGVGSKGHVFFFFSESSRVAYQINRNEAENTMQANILPFLHTHNPCIGLKHFF